MKTCYFPVTLSSFKNLKTSWVQFSGGQHHTVCLDADGKTWQAALVCSRTVSANCFYVHILMRTLLLCLSFLKHTFYCAVFAREGVQPWQSRLRSSWTWTGGWRKKWANAGVEPWDQQQCGVWSVCQLRRDQRGWGGEQRLLTSTGYTHMHTRMRLSLLSTAMLFFLVTWLLDYYYYHY